MPTRTDHILFRGAAVLLWLLAVGIVFLVPWPPMQDYPQHLFIAHVNADYGNPAHNWPRFYQAGLHLAPYSAFYLLTAALDRAVGILTAGKIVLCLYLTLIAAVIRQTARNRRRPPWAALLLLPLAFHQMYFMGFTNFLLSIPLLLMTTSRKRPPVIGEAVLAGLIFLCHPYTLLVYIVLAMAGAFLAERGQRRRGLIVPLAAALVFLVWYALNRPAGERLPLLWWPAADLMRYYLLPFNGFLIHNGLQATAVLPWLGVAACLLSAGFHKGEKTIPGRRSLVFFALTLAGYALLPFWAGKYSYFNLRLAPISYALAVLAAATLPLRRSAGLILAALCAVLLLQSATLQRRISDETATIMPVIEQMRPNATVLPIVFATGSSALDKKFFPEAHAHDFFYYHLIAGGGANPNLFPNPMLPIAFKKGVTLPAASHGFSWNEQGRYYNYILTREAPAAFAPFIGRFVRPLASSPPWTLYLNPAQP